VLKALPPRRQNLMFSATVPKEIMGLTREILKDPVSIDLERKSAPAVGITQAVYPVHRERKAALLVELLRRRIIEDAIVFTRTKHRANRLSDYLERQGIASAKIHGNRSQSQRTAALAWVQGGDAQGAGGDRTSPPAASTWRSWGTWSTSTSPPIPTPTCTGWAAPPAPDRPATPSPS
jgi:ATP-dependent RNA helicase RhlE